MPAKRSRHSKVKPLRNAEQGLPMVKGVGSSLSETGLENQGFVVDLFLDQQREVRLTQILHVKSNDGDAWEGWDEARMNNFLISRANLVIPESDAEIETGDSSGLFAEANLTERLEPEAFQPCDSMTESQPAQEASLLSRSETVETPIEHGVQIIPYDAQSAARCLAQGEPFNIRLLLPERHFAQAGEADLDFQVAISAFKKGQKSKFFIASKRGMFKSGDAAIEVNIPRQNLERGVYSIAAELEVTAPQNHEIETCASLVASFNLKSRLLQII